MQVVKITKAQWAQGLKRLKDTFRLFGPVKENGIYAYKELGRQQTPDLDFDNSRLSPKDLLFPQSETMLTCSLDPASEQHHIYQPVEPDDAPRAVVGIRPCDAKAISLVKMNFDSKPYQDPYWLNLYHSATLVGLACDRPGSTCFCTSTGCGPYHEEGLDILLTDHDDHYQAQALTEKGNQLLAAAGWDQQVDAAQARKAIAAKRAKAEANIVSSIQTGNLRTADTMALYNADFWEDVSFACINCGTCTFTCPTCWCFDIQDETAGRQSRRMRNWDSCMFPIFSVHTTGHNPRGAKLQRVRQRFMHKLKYFVDKYESGIMCVGCGRCVRQCPVNIDIRRVCELMNNLGAGTACAVQEK